ncbi:KH domain-containing protein [Halalkalibacter akibai]|uniref:RNA-binding protein KhpA n=1 Tax=Halalkalibacter akibai (strain ATCC 43226 / DSM 21942 / CIP 109018 / JCM 9157 / 1139) TaxID=1236973 RepID=W4QPV6_HALA3|nr:KH domain-containing protein [Halalkalibacter akibai]GAE33927.1 KH domain RNA binding protein YlqC [Halalkalibacter akibai JCM 9157]
MKALVEHIVKALVDQKDYVRVEEIQEGQTLSIKLTVHPDDMGKVIGKQGRTAKAIRSVLYAATPEQRVRLDIVD